MKVKTSSWLRLVHFLAGLSISFSIFFMPDDGWSNAYNNIMKFGVVGFVFWTGVIRWNLPRIRRWRAKQRAQAA